MHKITNSDKSTHLNKYENLFIEALSFMEFSLDKDEDGFLLIDEQGANLGNIDEDRFDSASAIIDRLEIYWNDYFFENLEYGFDNSERTEECPSTAEEWLAFAERHADFKEYYEFELSVLEMWQHADEIELEKCLLGNIVSIDKEDLKMDIYLELRNKVNTEFENYTKEMLSKSTVEIFNHSHDISRIKDIRMMLTDNINSLDLSETDIAELLEAQNILQDISDYYNNTDEFDEKYISNVKYAIEKVSSERLYRKIDNNSERTYFYFNDYQRLEYKTNSDGTIDCLFTEKMGDVFKPLGHDEHFADFSAMCFQYDIDEKSIKNTKNDMPSIEEVTGMSMEELMEEDRAVAMAEYGREL